MWRFHFDVVDLSQFVYTIQLVSAGQVKSVIHTSGCVMGVPAATFPEASGYGHEGTQFRFLSSEEGKAIRPEPGKCCYIQTCSKNLYLYVGKGPKIELSSSVDEATVFRIGRHARDSRSDTYWIRSAVWKYLMIDDEGLLVHGSPILTRGYLRRKKLFRFESKYYAILDGMVLYWDSERSFNKSAELSPGSTLLFSNVLRVKYGKTKRHLEVTSAQEYIYKFKLPKDEDSKTAVLWYNAFKALAKTGRETKLRSPATKGVPVARNKANSKHTLVARREHPSPNGAELLAAAARGSAAGAADTPQHLGPGDDNGGTMVGVETNEGRRANSSLRALLTRELHGGGDGKATDQEATQATIGERAEIDVSDRVSCMITGGSLTIRACSSWAEALKLSEEETSTVERWTHLPTVGQVVLSIWPGKQPVRRFSASDLAQGIQLGGFQVDEAETCEPVPEQPLDPQRENYQEEEEGQGKAARGLSRTEHPGVGKHSEENDKEIEGKTGTVGDSEPQEKALQRDGKGNDENSKVWSRKKIKVQSPDIKSAREGESKENEDRKPLEHTPRHLATDKVLANEFAAADDADACADDLSLEKQVSLGSGNPRSGETDTKILETNEMFQAKARQLKIFCDTLDKRERMPRNRNTSFAMKERERENDKGKRPDVSCYDSDIVATSGTRRAKQKQLQQPQSLARHATTPLGNRALNRSSTSFSQKTQKPTSASQKFTSSSNMSLNAERNCFEGDLLDLEEDGLDMHPCFRHILEMSSKSILEFGWFTLIRGNVQYQRTDDMVRFGHVQLNLLDPDRRNTTSRFQVSNRREGLEQDRGPLSWKTQPGRIVEFMIFESHLSLDPHTSLQLHNVLVTMPDSVRIHFGTAYARYTLKFDTKAECMQWARYLGAAAELTCMLDGPLFTSENSIMHRLNSSFMLKYEVLMKLNALPGTSVSGTLALDISNGRMCFLGALKTFLTIEFKHIGTVSQEQAWDAGRGLWYCLLVSNKPTKHIYEFRTHSSVAVSHCYSVLVKCLSIRSIENGLTGASPTLPCLLTRSGLLSDISHTSGQVILFQAPRARHLVCDANFIEFENEIDAVRVSGHLSNSAPQKTCNGSADQRIKVQEHRTILRATFYLFVEIPELVFGILVALLYSQLCLVLSMFEVGKRSPVPKGIIKLICLAHNRVKQAMLHFGYRFNPHKTGPRIRISISSFPKVNEPGVLLLEFTTAAAVILVVVVSVLDTWFDLDGGHEQAKDNVDLQDFLSVVAQANASALMMIVVVAFWIITISLF
mmetsp:Transcript_21327/g.29872  ORF Transcript_21327/g.29872 Transcript_21327/m.29872 type:complete len:1276 (-) Transcript_21327:252-4079(-)